MEIVKKRIQKWLKMESKHMALFLRKSLNYKSGLFYDSIGSAFFEVPTRALLATVAIFRGQKVPLSVLVQKIWDHIYSSNFSKQNEPLNLFFSLLNAFFDNFHFYALLGPILESESNQNNKWNFEK